MRRRAKNAVLVTPWWLDPLCCSWKPRCQCFKMRELLIETTFYLQRSVVHPKEWKTQIKTMGQRGIKSNGPGQKESMRTQPGERRAMAELVQRSWEPEWRGNKRSGKDSQEWSQNLQRDTGGVPLLGPQRPSEHRVCESPHRHREKNPQVFLLGSFFSKHVNSHIFSWEFKII